MKVKFQTNKNEDGIMIYPDDIEMFSNCQIIIEEDLEYIICDYNGSTLPPNTSEVDEEEEVVSKIISKVEFLNRMGNGAILFLKQIESETDLLKLAKLKLMKEYLNATNEINLESEIIKSMISDLYILNILTEEEMNNVLS